MKKSRFNELQRYCWTMNRTTLLVLILSTLFLINGHRCLMTPNQFSSNDLVNNKNPVEEWSPWSPWSSCSRICDGGISTSVRRCLSKSGCFGHHKRNKLCNMQPCMVKNNFRQAQCSSFNNKPYRDRFYEWLAFIDPADPCSLTCKAKGLNFVAKLAPRINDGTRCRPDSLDVCVAGKCLSVGCDLQLGSLKKIDDCGICGGDGSSCRNHSYAWSHRFLSNCSKLCAGGLQSSTVVCFDESTDTVVDDIFCLVKKKPDPLTKSCNEFDCKPNWETEEWSMCSRKCGIGIQSRNVYCVLERKDQIKIKVDDQQCNLKKPDSERKCNIMECPQWFEGPWSECSESCGNGIQRRQVICKDNSGYSSNECDVSLKPIDLRNCSDISNCLNGKSNSQEDSPNIDLKLIDEPIFELGEWSQCNATCGLGFRTRSVKCKIYLEFSQTFLTIPTVQCTKNKPSEIEACYGFDCNLNEIKPNNNLNMLKEEIMEKYLWTVTDFTECSAHCLGGIQETIIKCIRMRDNQPMPNRFCDEDLKPETYTRICNDEPCIPRWNLTEFGECSKKCGEGGLQSRIVLCVHEVTRGPNNLVVVPDNQCQSPKPSTEQKCNQVDCPAKWIVEPWQKCSKDCGGGIKKRNIHCVKDFIFGGLQNVSHIECSIRKPKISKLCNLKPCHKSNAHSNELVRKSKRNHSVNPVNNKFHRKHTFKVQGKVTVLEGSRVKLFCPEWDEHQYSFISWFKGLDLINNNRNYIMTENILKIRNVKLTNTGVYKCIYNNNIMHSMFLHVLPKKVPNETTNVLNQYVTKQSVVDSINHYYQNELDVSKEMEKYSLKSEPKIIAKINLIDEKPQKTHQLMGGIHQLITTFKKEFSTLYKSEDSSKEIGTETIHPTKSQEMIKEFNWITTDWSNCTIPCGGFGFKIRFSQCYIKVNNMTRIVEDSFCNEANLKKPSTLMTCGMESCSYWNISEWSECGGCIEINKALQTRNVSCLARNGTIIDESICFQWEDKPITRQGCYHPRCVPTWQVDEYDEEEQSKCHDKDVCVRNGSNEKPRGVRCVWEFDRQTTIDASFCKEAKIIKPMLIQ